jgi:hypothetical protein
MRDSMQRLLRIGLSMATCCIALLLGACGGDDNGAAPPTAAAPATATALAVSQIDGQTCENNDPQPVNGLNLKEDEDQTDPTLLTPACSMR